jgi:hypothetical protein
MLSVQATGSSSLLYAQNVHKARQPSTDMSEQMKADFTEALKSAGVDESAIPELLEKIQEAVATVTSSSTSGDLGDVIKQTVQSVLQENGVDVAKFDAAMAAQRPQGPPPPPPAAASSNQSDQQNLLDLLSVNATDDTQESLIQQLLAQLRNTGSLFDASV